MHSVNNQPCLSNGCKPENGIILFVILACHHCVLHTLTKKQPLFPKAALRFFQFTPSRPAVHSGKRWRSWWRSRSSRRDDKFVSVQQRAAGVDDVRDVAFALRFV